MNILLQFDELDNLIVEHTRAPATAVLRNKLHTIREQLEAHFETESHAAKELADVKSANLQFENARLKIEADSLTVLKALATKEEYFTPQELADLTSFEVFRVHNILAGLSMAELIHEAVGSRFQISRLGRSKLR